MRNLIQKKWMLSIASFIFIFLSTASAANYIVSGSSRSELNGTYVETGTWNQKPLYILDNVESDYAIGFEDGKWLIGRWGTGGYEQMKVYYIVTSAQETPPTIEWVRLIVLEKLNDDIYKLSGVEPSRFNGEYFRREIFNDRPLYILENEGMKFAIGFADGKWKIGDWRQEGDGYAFHTLPFFEIETEHFTPPTTLLEGKLEYDFKVGVKSLSYSESLFTEHSINDGSIANSIVITYNEYNGDAFTGNINDNFISDNKVIVNNVPVGLTASIIKTAGNELTFSLIGNATNHTQTDRIDNIVLTFENAAFNQESATDVNNYIKSDIGIQYKITFSGGSGIIADPYLISNKSDLRVLSENWGGDLLNKHFKQTEDISFQSSDFQSGGDFYNGGRGWFPIGEFSGIYDGQNHTISGLFINRTNDSDQGMFGRLVGYGAKIKNLGLVDVNITGNYAVGGLVGKCVGSMINDCYTTGIVNGITHRIGGLVGDNQNSLLTNCYSSAIIIGHGIDYGGLVGLNRNSTIINSYSTGRVYGEINVGGFVGQNNVSNIINCYSNGNVTRISGTDNSLGGFIGVYAGGSIRNSYSTGSVSYTGVTNPTDKGFVGIITTGTISNCYWDTQASGQTSSASTAIGKTSAEMKTLSTFSAWDFATPVWRINGANNSGYPYLAWRAFSPIVAVEANSNSSTLNLSGSSDVEVAAGVNLTLDANATINSLILAPTAKLSLGSNTLNAPNGVILQSSVDGTATILGDNAVSNATVQQYVTAGRNWYISSPLSSADYNALSRGTSVVEWNEVTKNWDTKSSGTLTQGKGYIQIADALQTGSTGTLSFGGTTNAGNINVAVTRTESGDGPGFNLVGNPYPSYLNWSGFIAEATNANISRTYWYRTKNTIGGYTFVTYNGVGGTYVTSNGTANTAISGKIPPMQGFWIRVNSGTASTTARFTNAMREHRDGNLNIFKAPKADERACLRLQLINGAKSDETMIYFDENAANLYDDYDSPKMMNNSDVDPDLYTKAGNERLVINGLKSVTDNLELPLGFSLNAPANLKIKASELVNFGSGTRIYLLDKTEKTQTEFYPETEYSFSTKTATTNNENRFSLLFRTPGISTGVENDGEQAVNVFVNATNQLIVAAPINSSYAIYNAVGQQINSGITTSYLQTANCKLHTGMYFVKVLNNGKELTSRIIIK